MCGIVGYILNDRDGELPLAKSVRQLGHRGPDSLSVTYGPGVGLGSARLALVGGESGQQPCVADDDESLLVLNGEIYNWRNLGTENAESDTRVASRLLASKGAEALRLFRGGYALAYFDAKEDSLLLARDHFGQKPLYLRESAKGLRFASEPHALFDQGERPVVDEAALSVLLRFQFLPPGTSLFKGVRAIPQGEWLLIKRLANGKLEKTTGKIPWPNSRSGFGIYNNFLLACKRQSAGDENSAILLSGGLDSTAVLGGLAATGHVPTDAWVGYFPDGPESWDERPYARIAAEEFGVSLHELAITPKSYAEAMPRAIASLGEPVAGPGGTSQFLLCEAAAKEHRVLYGGQGGDELFGGYARLSLLQLLDQDQDSDFDPAYEPLLNRMKKARAQYPFDALAPYREAVDRGRALLPFASLYGQSLCAQGASVEACLGGESPGGALATASLFEWRVLLPGLLQVDDRCCSAFGMEGRSPFLDQDLAAQMLRIPLSEKSPAYEARRLFRSEFATLLPSEVMGRRDKLGFPHPLLSWWRGPLKVGAPDPLKSLGSRDKSIIREAGIPRLIENDGQGGRLVYFLIMLELWQQTYIDDGIRHPVFAAQESRSIRISKGAFGQ